MTKTTKRIMLAFAAVLGAICLTTFFASPLTAKAEGTWTNDGGWTYAEGVYTKTTDIGNVAVLSYSEALTLTEISADVMTNTTWTGDVDANVGFTISLTAGDRWFIDYTTSPDKNYVRIRYYDAIGNEYWASYAAYDLNIAADEYFNFKVARDGATLTAYVNDTEIVGYTSGSGADSFIGASYKFSSWGNLASVKNLTVVGEAAPEAEPEEWLKTGWNKDTESEEVVYTATTQELTTLKYNGNMPEGTTAVEFYVRFNEGWNGGDTANLTFYVGNGNQYLRFSIWHFWKAMIYGILDGQFNTIADWVGSCNYVENKVDGWNSTDAWNKVKVSFNSHAIVFYYNDVKVYATGADWNLDHSNGLTCMFTSWGCSPSVKGITFISEDIPTGWYGDYNETTVGGVSTYQCNNTDLTYLYYKGNVADYNTVEFAFMPNEACWGDTANVSFHVETGDYGITVTFMNFWKYISINDITKADAIAAANYPEKLDAWTGYDIWYNVKIEFTRKAINVYINDTLYAYTCLDLGFDYEDLSYYFHSWGQNEAIKDIKLSNSQITANHVAATDAAVAPTCTEAGLTEGSHCSVCNEVLVAQESVEATGHAWGEPTFAWTEIENGYTATATFVCANDEDHTEVVDATVESVVEAATCTEAGKITYTATVEFNGGTYTDEKEVELEATGHEWGEWVVTTPATATEDGEETRTCLNDEDHKETRVIPATGEEPATSEEPAESDEPSESEEPAESEETPASSKKSSGCRGVVGTGAALIGAISALLCVAFVRRKEIR